MTEWTSHNAFFIAVHLSLPTYKLNSLYGAVYKLYKAKLCFFGPTPPVM